mmetsp:Transcript_103046/g.230164  ORF Transcript_103046/g.230164 Transcript_103046/m.230164 type:complete len:310 (-) Transcript_103046:230-1159(-)
MIVGNAKASTAKSKREYCVPAPTALNFCVLYFKPPKRKHMPKTRRRLEMILPIKLPFTTSVRPSRKANTEIIISTAFPKVALRRPPSVCPTEHAKSSVALPRSFARGTIAKKLKEKVATSPQPRLDADNPKGRKTRKMFIGSAKNIWARTLLSCSGRNQGSGVALSASSPATTGTSPLTNGGCLLMRPPRTSSVAPRASATAGASDDAARGSATSATSTDSFTLVHRICRRCRSRAFRRRSPKESAAAPAPVAAAAVAAAPTPKAEDEEAPAPLPAPKTFQALLVPERKADEALARLALPADPRWLLPL